MHETTALNARHVGLLTALLERMWPADDLGPGAQDMGIVAYLLRALEGDYADQVPDYTRWLARLDARVLQGWGSPFASLPSSAQDDILDLLSRRELDGVDDDGHPGFFDRLWTHLREGLFSDPRYGGNRGMEGWKLIGFPGVQYGYEVHEQQVDVVLSRPYRALPPAEPDSTVDR
jgi:hypothetical protein